MSLLCSARLENHQTDYGESQSWMCLVEIQDGRWWCRRHTSNFGSFSIRFGISMNLEVTKTNVGPVSTPTDQISMGSSTRRLVPSKVTGRSIPRLRDKLELFRKIQALTNPVNLVPDESDLVC